MKMCLFLLGNLIQVKGKMAPPMGWSTANYMEVVPELGQGVRCRDRVVAVRTGDRVIKLPDRGAGQPKIRGVHETLRIQESSRQWATLLVSDNALGSRTPQAFPCTSKLLRPYSS